MSGVAGSGDGFWNYGWSAVLGAVWLALLIGTVVFLGFRLTQSARRRDAAQTQADATRAIQALERASQRMTVLDFVKRASRQGWDVSGRSIQIMDLMQGLRQACSAERIRTWGRPISPHADQMRTELHRSIPAPHWKQFEFDIDTIVGRADNFETKSCNLKQSERHSGGYVDIYVDQQAALDWLDGDAEKLKRAASR